MNETAKNVEDAKSIRSLSALIGVLGVLGVLLQLNLPRARAQQEGDARPQQLVGVGSCTSVGCHGGDRKSIVGSEYSIWIAQDPHARAYSALYDERSLRMLRLLDRKPPNADVQPQTDDRCLVCHSMKHADAAEQNIDVLSDGVGCEACHGPASQWIGEHYPRTTSAQSRQRLRDLGMWDTDSLLERTRACVKCHVGGPGREVNHDLIAAGHPRLQFEMGAYFAALPKHWIDEVDRQGRADDFEAKLWALGQVSTSQAALEQLARRATPGAHVWPEFAEWSCSACHHDLRDDADTQKALAQRDGLSGRMIEWDRWNHFMSRKHAADVGQAFMTDNNRPNWIAANIQLLDKHMQPLNPERKQVADLALRTASELGRWAIAIENSRITRPRLNALTRALINKEPADWSSAAQTYDAIASFHETWLRNATPIEQRANDDLTSAFKKLHDNLAQDPTSPDKYLIQRAEVQKHLVDIANLIQARQGDE